MKNEIGRSRHESTVKFIYSEKETAAKEVIGYAAGAVSVCIDIGGGRKVRELQCFKEKYECQRGKTRHFQGIRGESIGWKALCGVFF